MRSLFKNEFFKDKLVIIFCYAIGFAMPIYSLKKIAISSENQFLISFFFLLAIVYYFQFIIEFGFQTSLLKRLHHSFKNNDVDGFSKIISASFIFRFVIFFILLVMILLYLFFKDEIYNFYIIFVLLSSVFSYQFLFQVVDDLRTFYVISTLVKLFFFPFIVLFNDFFSLAIIYSLFNLMPNLITAVYFFIKYKIKLSSGCKVGFVFIVKGNFNYFLSNFSITLYTTYYQVLLGLLSPMYLPAYALSDKIVRSVISANYIFIQIIQVYFLKLNANITKRNFFLILTFLVSVALVETIFLMCFALWGGEKFFGNIIMLKDFLILMTAIIPIVILSNFWGMVYLPCTGNIGSLSKIFIKVSMLSLVLSPLLVYLFHGYGAIFSSVLSESLVLIMCFFVSKNIIKEREFR